MSAKLIMRQNSTIEYSARTDRPSVDYPLLCTVISGGVLLKAFGRGRPFFGLIECSL